MVNLSRFNDEKIRNKELSRQLMGYVAKIQVLKCDIKKLVGEGKTLHAIRNDSFSDSSSMWSSPPPTRRRQNKHEQVHQLDVKNHLLLIRIFKYLT